MEENIVEVDGRKIDLAKLTNEELDKLHEEIKKREDELKKQINEYRDKYPFLKDIDWER